MDIGEAYEAVMELLEDVPKNPSPADMLQARLEASDKLGIDYADLHAFSVLPALQAVEHYTEHDCSKTCIDQQTCLLGHMGSIFEQGILLGALYHREKSAALSEMFKEGGDHE